MDRGAIAVWKGSGKTGKGTVRTDSGAVNDRTYSARATFEQEGQDPIIGTNPEELLGAAHASCFSMALAILVSEAGYTPVDIHTEARVHMERHSRGWVISQIQLHCTAKVPGLESELFHELAHKAKVGCPISLALKPEITLTSTLE